jgi:hypothetical protein
VIRNRTEGLAARAHLAYGRIARQLPPERRTVASQRLEQTSSREDTPVATLARQAALAMTRGTALEAGAAVQLRGLVHDGLLGLLSTPGFTERDLGVVLGVAESLPDVVDSKDVLWLTRLSDPELRIRAHALLAKLGKTLPLAPVVDARTAARLADAELVAQLGEPHLVGHAALIAEAGRRGLVEARPAIVRCVHGVLDRARPGEAELLPADEAILEAAVPVLCRGERDGATIAVLDRMLRHANPAIKHELLTEPPVDERLLAGMFHVLTERGPYGEQVQDWLAQFADSPAFAEAYELAGRPELGGLEDADDDDDDELN